MAGISPGATTFFQGMPRCARMTGLFCEHKRLRTSCPHCKATALPPPPTDARPYVSQDEREAREERRSAPRAPKASPQPGAVDQAEDEKKERRRGPGNPLMPTRAKKRGVSAEEAAAAKPWWVKK